MKLSVHLQNEKSVYFAEGEEDGARRAAPRCTMLTASFDLKSAPPGSNNPAVTIICTRTSRGTEC